MRVVIFLLLCFSSFVFAIDPFTNTLFACFSFPQGNFAAESAENGGYADMGFGGGMDLSWRVGDTGFSWTTTLTYLSNMYGGEDFNQDVDMDVYDSSAFDNFNILTGFKYTFEFSETFAVFMHARYGYSWCSPPTLDGSVHNALGEQFDGQLGFDGTSSTASAFGFGINMNETFRLSLEYMNFGSHTFTSGLGYEENGVDISVPIEWDMDVKVLLLTFGYNINF